MASFGSALTCVQTKQYDCEGCILPTLDTGDTRMPLWSRLVYVLGPEIGILAGEDEGRVQSIHGLHHGPALGSMNVNTCCLG